MSDAKCKCKCYNMYICNHMYTKTFLHSQGKCYDWMWYDCACCAKPAGMLKFSIHPVHFFIARTSLRGQFAIFLHLQSDEKHPATVEDSSNTGIFGGCLYRNWCRILVKQQFFTGGKRGFDPKYIVSITTTAGEADKNHINPSSCLGCGSGSMHVPVYIGTAIKQFQYRTTGYLVLTQPHIFKLSTVQQQSQ